MMTISARKSSLATKQISYSVSYVKTPKPRERTMKTEHAKEKHRSFIADIQEIRRRAREHMGKGAVTEGYKAICI